MNYDAFFGIVKNYNWDLLSNGSYKITINTISTGEVIESLKINANVSPNKTAEGNTPQFQKSTLHKLMGNVVALVTGNSGTVNGYGAGSSLNSPALASYSGIEYNYLISGDNNSASGPNGTLANNEGASVTFNNIEPTKDSNSTTQYYIKLGALLRIIQAFNLYYDTNTSGNPPVFKINTDFNDNKCLTIPNHASLDPGVCVIALDLDTTVAAAAGLAGGLPYLKTTTVYDYSGFAQYTNGVPSYTYDTFPTQEYVANLASFALDKEIITDVSASNLPDIFRTQTVNNLFPIGGELGSNSIPQDDIETRLGPIENSILNSPSIGQAGFDPNVLYFGNVKITTVTYQTAPTGSGSVINTNVLKKNIDKEFRTADSLVGNMMHIYVNINFITATLDNNTDASTGKISVFDFLKKLLDGIKASLGYINDFKVIYEHDDNMYHIIDDSYLAYAYDKSSPNSARFNINLLQSDNGSFVTKFGLKSDLFAKTANAAAMGAQTNGNTLISNSVPFSRFNEGLIDRTIPKKRNKNTDDDPKQDFSEKYTTAYIDYFTFLTEVYGNGNASRAILDQYRSSVKDLFEFDLAYYTDQGNTPGTYLIPLNLNLTLEGLSGVDLLQTFTIDETLLPDEYYNRIRFITKGISHKIDSRGWETSLETFSLPKLGSSLNTSVKRPKKVKAKTTLGGTKECFRNGVKYDPHDTAIPGVRGDLVAWVPGPNACENPRFENSYIVGILSRNSALDKPLYGRGSMTYGNSGAPQLPLSEIERFYAAILTQMGFPTTDGNLIFMRAWRKAEGGQAAFNPWNTTQLQGAYGCYNKVKGSDCHVKNYQTFEDGVKATIDTFNGRWYGTIRKALKRGLADKAEALELAKLTQQFDMTGKIPAKWL
jgi:hypothetical protein